MTRGDQRDRARAKSQKKLQESNGASSQLKANEKNMTILCKICRQTFFCTTNESQLQEHVNLKHPKSAYDACFS